MNADAQLDSVKAYVNVGGGDYACTNGWVCLCIRRGSYQEPKPKPPVIDTQWIPDPWDKCTEACMQARTLQCIATGTDMQAPAEQCDKYAKPEVKRACVG